ncbi:hypothetical protein ACN5LI_001080 [Cronobacter turicensis]
MRISKDVIKEIMAGSFLLELVEITLQQQIKVGAKIFSGSGFFYYKDNKPYIKFLHKESNSQHRAFATYLHLDIGELIGKEHFFELTATDLDGNIWHAIDIDPYPGIKASQQGISFDCELHTLKMVKHHDYEKYFTAFFVPRKLKIPCNKFQNRGEDGSRRTRSTFQLDFIEVNILLEDDYSQIELTSDTDLSLEDAYTILESFSVAGGILLTPAFIIHQTPTSKEFKFSKIDNKFKHELMEFIPRTNPQNLPEWVNFSESYIKKFNNDKTFYYYWVKIFNAHQADLENETLSLTVSIEGLVNKFFSAFKKEDTEFRDMCSKSLPEIIKLDIDERVKQSIIALLKRNGSSSIKGTLFNMAALGIFPKELVDDWYKARNKSAHAEHFHKDSWGENIKKYTHCITLFYFLLSYHINYKGAFCQYHIPGAPLKPLNINADDDKQSL